MNADELYEQAIQANRKPMNIRCTLEVRILNLLYRSGYKKYEKDENHHYSPITEDCNLDRERILADVMNGSILDKHGIGPRSLRQICEWLSEITTEAKTSREG